MTNLITLWEQDKQELCVYSDSLTFVYFHTSTKFDEFTYFQVPYPNMPKEAHKALLDYLTSERIKDYSPMYSCLTNPIDEELPLSNQMIFTLIEGENFLTVTKKRNSAIIKIVEVEIKSLGTKRMYSCLLIKGNKLYQLLCFKMDRIAYLLNEQLVMNSENHRELDECVLKLIENSKEAQVPQLKPDYPVLVTDLKTKWTKVYKSFTDYIKRSK